MKPDQKHHIREIQNAVNNRDTELESLPNIFNFFVYIQKKNPAIGRTIMSTKGRSKQSVKKSPVIIFV